MRIYLDNCCFNRPFDDQNQARIRLEAEAKLCIQEGILQARFELAWSYMLDYENAANPFDERRSAIQLWRNHAVADIIEIPEILQKAEALWEKGLKSKDALHIACAIVAGCNYFITTDESILRKLRAFKDITVVDPTTFVRSTDL